MANNSNEASLIKIRRDTKANWESLDPVLSEGEIGIEWVNLANGICYIKIGNGVSHWNQLSYFSGKDISYSNIVESTLPKINNKTITGNLTLEDLGIQPAGNYAYSSYVNAQLDSKANSDDVYPRQYIDAKFNEYVEESLVPSLDGNEGKYLKVVENGNKPAMMWSEISNDYVTTEDFEQTLQDYIQKEEGSGLVNLDDYSNLNDDVETLKDTVYNNETGLVETVDLLKDEVDGKVSEEELKKILTGDETGGTPLSTSGYASKDEIDDKASIEQLNAKADNDVVQAHIYNAYNPHHITKETIGLSHVDDTADLDKPISRATQTALNDKMYNYDIGTGLGVTVGTNNKLTIYNKIQQSNWSEANPDDTACILNKPSNEEFQANWLEGDDTKLSYIRNKPTINEYVLPVAETEKLGGIKLGQNFDVDEQGHLKYIKEIDYTTLINIPSFLAPIRYPLVNKGEVSSVSNLPTINEIGDYYRVTDVNMDYAWDVDEKWIVLTDYDKTVGFITDPRHMVEYPFINQMTAADLNLASLTVAKSIDDRLEATKVDKTSEVRKIYGTDEYGDQCTYAFDNVEAVSEAIEQLGDLTLIAKYNSSANSGTPVEDYVARNLYGYGKVNDYDGIKSDKVYSIDDTCNKNYIETNFARHDNRITLLQQNKEENMYKTSTIDGLTNEQYQIYYPTAGAVKTKTDEMIAEYNAKITAETNRATARENAIENDLHTNYYTKPEIDTKVSSVYRYKGTVQTYYLLPTENNVEGDVWNIVEEDAGHGIKAGDNVAWVAAKSGVEAHWDVLAGITNLSNYYTKQEVDTTFATKGEYQDEMDNIEDEIEELATYTETELATKATKANTLDGYGITDAYTKVDTEVLINNAVSDKALQVEVDAITAPAIYRGTVEYYNELPSNNVEVNDLYVVSSTREYYVWNGSAWIKQVPLGDKADKLTTYTKSEIDSNFATITLVNTKASTLSLNSHTSNTNNPHSVTKAQVGLGNVDNTSDANKPISTATQVALNNKQDSLNNTQLAAVNSGVTADRVQSYETAVATIPTLATNSALAEVRQTANTAAATVATKADANNVYTKAEIDGKLTSGMHFKGTVPTVSQLPSSQQQIGDMYNVLATGANYAWDGSNWDKLSEVIDLSVYYTKSEIDSTVSDINDDIDDLETNLQAQINGKQATLTAGANVTIENNVISADVEGTLATNLSELNNDVGFITLSQVPAINNGILTIQKNGADIGTFTANSATDNSINITVPTKVTDLSDASNYAKSSTLATVATSGSYNDLSNKPTIGTATLTIQKNGTTVDTFSANATENKTVNITVPTTVAELSDASNYELPSQTGNEGKFLTTDGTDASWATVDALPSQTGNTGKFLTTNGSAASWETITIPSEIFLATYGTTTYSDIMSAINNNKIVYVVETQGSTQIYYTYRSHTSNSVTFYIASGESNTIVMVDNNNNWDYRDNYFLPSQLGNNGKFLTTNGSTASWETVTMPTVDQTYDATSANAQSGVAINGAKFLQNQTSSTYALRLSPGNDSTMPNGNYSIAIGKSTGAQGDNSTSIGYYATATGDYSVAIGAAAQAIAKSGIQIGRGANATPYTLSVGFTLSDDSVVSYRLLEGTTGKIPDDRLNTTIARTNNYYTKSEIDTMIGNIESILQQLNSGNN